MVQRPRQRKESIRFRQEAAEYPGQEDSAESTCCGKDCLCMIEMLESWSWGSRLSSGRFGSGVTRRQGS